MDIKAPIAVVLGYSKSTAATNSMIPVPIRPQGSIPNSEKMYTDSSAAVNLKNRVLAQYNIFAGDPGFVDKDIKNILAVTAADVKRVYEKVLLFVELHQVSSAFCLQVRHV